MEIERARLTKTLATIKEQNGEVKEAASILQELQVTRGVVTVTSVIEINAETSSSTSAENAWNEINCYE